MVILLDVLAANSASHSDAWGIHPEHFVERHGLIVIIALGESLIVAGAGLVGAEITFDLLAVGLFAVLSACALWWSYFPYVRPLLEHELSRSEGSAQARMARDVFSLGHFPLLCGIIAFAAALESAVVHPHDAMDFDTRTEMAAGLFLFTAAAAYAQFRATGIFAKLRLSVAAVAGIVIVMLEGLPPWVTIAIAFGATALVVIIEHSTCHPLVEERIAQNTGPE